MKLPLFVGTGAASGVIPFGGNTSLLDSIISYWKADDNGSFPDSLGINDGTINGATFTASGKINGGYTFDGANDYISIADDASLTPTDFTINMWVKTTQTTVSSLYTKRNGGFAGILFTLNSGASGAIQMDIYDTADRFSRSTNQSINNGSWNMITATCDSTGDILLYKNGVEVSAYSVKHTTGFAMPNTNGSSHFGAFAPTPSGYYNGDMDEIGMWSKVLTTTNITDLYNSGSGLQY